MGLAHRVGFVKCVGATPYSTPYSYLSYVAVRRLRYDQLSPCFLALSLRRRLEEFENTAKASRHVEFLEFMLTGLSERARLPVSSVVHTNSNLSSDILKDIVIMLGLDYSVFELKENMIDNQLLYWRNNIAHGQYMYPKEEEYDVLFHEISELIRLFKSQIENAATLHTYTRVGRG